MALQKRVPQRPQRTLKPAPKAKPVVKPRQQDTERGSKLMMKIRDNQKRVTMGKGIFKEDVRADFFNPKVGEHIIDIVPFDMGANSPVDRGRPLTPEGEPDYVLDLWVHYGEGVAGDQSVVCLAKTYEKKCPICEHRTQLLGDGDQDGAEALKPKRRTLYNVVCYDSAAEESKGIQVWNVAFFYMEKHLLKLAKQPIRAGRSDIDPYINFASEYSDGKSISFEIGDSGEYKEYAGHKLIDRDYDLPQEIVDSAYQLDQLIYIPSYEEIHQLHYQDDSTEEEEELQGPEEEEVVEEAPITRTRRSLRAPKQKVEEVEEEVFEEDEAVEEEIVEDGEEVVEEAPPARRGRPARKAPVIEEDNTCIGEGVFGKDNGELQECNECSLFDVCYEEKERLESSKPKPKGRTRR